MVAAAVPNALVARGPTKCLVTALLTPLANPLIAISEQQEPQERQQPFFY